MLNTALGSRNERETQKGHFKSTLMLDKNFFAEIKSQARNGANLRLSIHWCVNWLYQGTLNLEQLSLVSQDARMINNASVIPRRLSPKMQLENADSSEFELRI